jgi:hypothetical protein
MGAGRVAAKPPCSESLAGVGDQIVCHQSGKAAYPMVHVVQESATVGLSNPSKPAFISSQLPISNCPAVCEVLVCLALAAAM